MIKGVITLCGSTRFYNNFKDANLRLTLQNWIVLSIGVDTKSDKDIPEVTDELKTKLDALHKRKIKMSDAIMVIDVDGYIGSSTRGEIEYAKKVGVDIYSYTKTWAHSLLNDKGALPFYTLIPYETGELEQMMEAVVTK